jgi:hypothetical protein
LALVHLNIDGVVEGLGGSMNVLDVVDSGSDARGGTTNDGLNVRNLALADVGTNVGADLLGVDTSVDLGVLGADGRVDTLADGSVDLLGGDRGIYRAELGADLGIDAASNGGVDLGVYSTLNVLLKSSVQRIQHAK